MANKVVNYKKIRTDIINGKKRCIYMKPKGKREYVKRKGEFVLLSVYIKKMQKKMKIKGGYGYFNEYGRYMYKSSTPLKNRVHNNLSNIKSYMKGLSGKTVKEYIPPSELYKRLESSANRRQKLEDENEDIFANFHRQQNLEKDLDADLNKRVKNESKINANNIGLSHRAHVSKIMNIFSKNPTSTPQSNNNTFIRADIVGSTHSDLETRASALRSIRKKPGIFSRALSNML